MSVKQRQRGLDEAGYVESFVILNTAGGECLDDFEPLEVGGVALLIDPKNARAARGCASYGAMPLADAPSFQRPSLNTTRV